MNHPTGTIFNIERNSYVDGPGIRTTVFFKGCNLRCAWCHNPESHSPNPQMMFYANQCTGCGVCKQVCPHGGESCELCGKCALYCPHGAREICGKEYTVEEIWKEIEKDRLFYEATGGGVTFSGGECMLQIDFLEAILKKCKQNGIHTAVDTAGHVPYESFERILPYTDLLLYDVKCMDSDLHQQYAGVDNKRILENLKRLLQSDTPVWIRIPVIPTVNDTEEEMKAIQAFLSSYGTPKKIELLPYHAMGEHKYRALGHSPAVFKAPEESRINELKQIFS
jgi:pyruvate formate lyase activating enzyme